MALRIIGSALAVLAAALAAAPASAERVDLQLVLAADVSSSIDDDEFALQREGYAAAFNDPRVLAAIRAGPHGRIAVALVEWSDETRQQVSVGWRVIRDEADAATFAATLRATPRPFAGRTAIGAAIDFAADQFDRSGHESPRRTIDISGDGVNTHGVPPAVARDRATSRGIAINGLAILSPEPPRFDPYHGQQPAGPLIADRFALQPGALQPPGGLATYFRENVAGGPGSFVLTVADFGGFARALANKLVREIALASRED